MASAAACWHAQHSGSVAGVRSADHLCGLLQVINDLFKPDKREGELELFLRQAELMAKEADGLQCNVTRDLEKLKGKPGDHLPACACTAGFCVCHSQ